ncbi:Uncharacterised protein [Streptococcus pneumoniae]|nr:Uncharacterised protein [Streptococcus pneumoniae]
MLNIPLIFWQWGYLLWFTFITYNSFGQRWLDCGFNNSSGLWSCIFWKRCYLFRFTFITYHSIWRLWLNFRLVFVGYDCFG